MRRFIGMVGVLCLATLGALAQDYPKVEVFGGYQYSHIDILGVTSLNNNGWNASVAGNVNKWFGVAGDVSGGYATVNGVSTRTYTYTGGPVFSYRNNEKLTPFAHALFGGFHASAGVSGLSTSTNGFAMQFGGGTDLKLSDRIAWRLAQVDWMLLHSQGETLNKNVRISTGIVFRF